METPPHRATPRPALDAEVLGGLLVARQRPQRLEAERDRVLHEPFDAEPVVREVAVEQRGALRRLRRLAVVPEVRRDVVLGVGARLGVQRGLDAERVESAGDMPRPVTSARGAATKTVTK